MITRIKAQPMILTVLVVTFCRLVVNMSRRFPYAFIPTISRQLGVPVSSVQNVMAMQAGVGVASPLFGPLAERYGRKRIMMASLVLLTAASVLGALQPQFTVFAVVMIVFGISKMVFDPAMMAYLGDRIPYRRRGAAMGITELSWAGSLIVVAPVVGFLLDAYSLQTAFGLLAALSLLAMMAMWRGIPGDAPAPDSAAPIVTPLIAWRTMRSRPAALGGVAYMLLISMANEVFFINYGIWMESSFGLLPTALGAVTIAIAAAEISGEFTVIGIADRLGKRRLALIASFFAGLMYLILPSLSFNLTLGLAGLFLMFLFVETSIVATLPLLTEIMPDARSIMMSSAIGAVSFGRLAGAAVGGFLFGATGDFYVIGTVALIIGLSAFVVMWRWVPESPLIHLT